MIARRLLLAAATILAVLLGSAHTAAAGGATFEFDAPSYQPGERAFGWANVSWDHYDFLGGPEDGPYHVYLLPFDPETSYDRPWDVIPADATYVADLEVHEGPYDHNGVRFGPDHATVEFTVPDLAPGEYEVLHCNDPCADQLGDLIWGELTVVEGVAPTTTTAPPPTTAPEEEAVAPLVADDPPPGWSGPLTAAAVVVGMALLGAFAFLVRRRVQLTPKPT